MMDLTAAQKRALQAVKDGLVTQVFDHKGNKWEGPAGINGRSYRNLQEWRLIEDVPGHRTGVSTTRVKQRLTEKGATIS